MFDTTLALLVSWLAQGICLVLGHAWQHPLLTTGCCLLLGFFTHADEQLRDEIGQQVATRWQRMKEHYSFSFLKRKYKPNPMPNYDYSWSQGPHTWTQTGSNQSPVNIDEQLVQRLAIHELLNWNHYDELPASITLENTGQTLLLRAQFRSNVPTISGADLLTSYTFVELCFHWGWSNSEGSEHTLNNRKYPLEMQVLHRTGASVPRRCTSSYDLLMVAYIFELSAHNPLLDPLMQNLKLVQMPGKRVQIAPFPLSYLVYPFRTGFYSYGGSLTQPPCYQGTEWFIFPESLAISDFQLRHFRQLLSGDCFTPISRNSRPVQPLGNRIVNLNYFCPYDTAQLDRMRLELLQQHQQEIEEEPEQTHVEEEQERQQMKLKTMNSSDDEGQLIESLDTTTTITTNSCTSVCATVLNREGNNLAQQQQHQQQQLNSCCPNSIIFFSSNNNYRNNSNSLGSTASDTSLMDKCNGHGHFQLDQTGEMMMNLSNDVGICGMGDGLGVGARIQLIE
ncbi:carbonic anhydrase 5A, mitochondrial [Drosophila albomicans]|uniref:Carbonic anhydrase 5A, mitochondrial n=1 Tax=Drosophila albomicans TaxID=7291 RepID=A0A6P8WEX9_DROAB|nr:carbonic anhydrase 5A, mitochondrial [Drosophila albomicans]